MSDSGSDVVGDLAIAVSRYSTRIHQAAGEGQHVLSPLGAWLILALCAPLAQGQTRSDLADVLGLDPVEAGRVAAQLLERPHPFLLSSAAVWSRSMFETAAFNTWRGNLPRGVDTGDIPDQQGLDTWANNHTLGLIKKFPISLSPDMFLVMASALATKVSWARPFALVSGSALGSNSEWSRKVNRVLASPNRYHHSAYITDTEDAGRVAVHTARAVGGVLVTSVIAEHHISRGHVLSAAHRIAVAEATDQEQEHWSLFDLPLGENDLWIITEEEVETKRADGREEHCMAVLPAWEAETNLALEDPVLGFSSAARALAGWVDVGPHFFVAKQSAMARYTRVGFEAAAVTAMATGLSAQSSRQGIRRTAKLRFGHPYAAVAVTVDEKGSTARHSPWHGLPVFSAWVAEPVEASV